MMCALVHHLLTCCSMVTSHTISSIASQSSLRLTSYLVNSATYQRTAKLAGVDNCHVNEPRQFAWALKLMTLSIILVRAQKMHRMARGTAARPPTHEFP